MSTRQTQINSLAQTSPSPLSLEIVKAHGCYLYDSEGKAYLDLVAGLAVNNVGHAHSAVLDALHKQADKYLHVIPYGEFQQEPQVSYANALRQVLPDKLNCTYFVNSGTEAVEASLKLAKRVTGRTELIGFEKSYHGSTHGSLSVTDNEQKKFRNRPLLPDTHCIAFNEESALQHISSKTAAVIVEPIQGDAGVRVPSTSWIQELRRITKEHEVLLIFDEVQTGFGRTGKLFAFEHFDVTPDILVLGKALGGGMPMGAFISSAEMMKLLSHDPVLGHITTFGGHPIPCVTGKAALTVIQEEQLAKRALEIGTLFLSRLQHERIKEVRGLGAMLAVELNSEEEIQRLVWSALDQGVLGFWFLSCPTAFRIAPPLTITDDQIEHACAVIHGILDQL